MRPQFNHQPQFDFHPRASLAVIRKYRAKYDRISKVLDTHPELVDPIHRDVALPDDTELHPNDSSVNLFKCSSESILRICICQVIEKSSLRKIIVRIDDSHYLRCFARIYNDPMIDPSTFCRLKNRITPETWKEVNERLTQLSADNDWIDGQKLRMDTTAVESHIHWPTDSSLLWDTYRTLARLVKKIRTQVDARTIGHHRLLLRKAKKLHTKIARKASGKKRCTESLEPLYIKLIQLVQNLSTWCDEIVDRVQDKLVRGSFTESLARELKRLTEEMIHYSKLGERVVRQAWMRVIERKTVANTDKIFSIFEPHTELLIRGKAGKNIEFGHMIQIEQVESKFITGYDVFEQNPVEHELVAPAMEHHKKVFGHYSEELAADKGYYENMERIRELSRTINVVSIAKKGKRSTEETVRETTPAFRSAQRFRAGIEGSISFLKRILGLARCYNKSWPHYAATVGMTILTHNLLILARW